MFKYVFWHIQKKHHHLKLTLIDMSTNTPNPKHLKGIKRLKYIASKWHEETDIILSDLGITIKNFYRLREQVKKEYSEMLLHSI